MKDTLVKERGEGRELKRKHKATLYEKESLQKEFQDLEIDRDSLVVQMTIMEGEKKDFEEKIAELEWHKSAAIRQVGELRTQVEELVAQRGYFEAQLSIENDRQLDITPFHDQAYII